MTSNDSTQGNQGGPSLADKLAEMQKLAEFLQGFIGSFNPLIPVVIGTGRLLIGLVRKLGGHNEAEVQKFEDEINRLDAALAAIDANDAAWRASHPDTPPAP